MVESLQTGPQKRSQLLKEVEPGLAIAMDVLVKKTRSSFAEVVIVRDSRRVLCLQVW